MRCFWLLLLLPNFCAARIVEVDDLVKKDGGYGVGTVVHETTSHMISPGEGWSPSTYKLGTAFRYRFGGVAREGKRVYIKLWVENQFLERLLTRNQTARHNSKTESLSNDLRTQSTHFELLLPTENGRATFPFPSRVVVESNTERVAVSEAVLELAGKRLRVLEVAGKVYPSSKLPWLPPRQWPGEDTTVYVGSPTEPEPAAARPSPELKMPGAQ